MKTHVTIMLFAAIVAVCFGQTTACNCAVCTLAKDGGPCFASFRRYYYDNDNGQCKELVYGGCLGNDNRFDSQSDCLAECGDCPAVNCN
ncbi:isoinhibitor K-like [Glandiceps talaboti]